MSTAVDLTLFAVQDAGERYADASKPPLAQDARDPGLPLRSAGDGRHGAARSWTKKRSPSNLLPSGFRRDEGDLTCQLDPSLAATTLDSLDYLRKLTYTVRRTETVSRFLPNIMTYRALAAFNLQDNQLRAGLEANVSFGVQRLLATQKVNGGWGWFVNSDANALTTAYALIGLSEAQEQGFPIEPA